MAEQEVNCNRTATLAVHLGPGQALEMAEQGVSCNRTATLAVHLGPGQALEMVELGEVRCCRTAHLAVQPGLK
jgi:hypothetical protein